MILESKCIDKKKIMFTIFYNIFTKNYKWQVVITYWQLIVEKKLSGGFKLKQVIAYHLKFVVKIL